MNAQLQPTANEAPQILLDVPAEEYHRRELGVATSSVLRRCGTRPLASIAPEPELRPN